MHARARLCGATLAVALAAVVPAGAAAISVGEALTLMAVPGTATPLTATANNSDLGSAAARVVSDDGRYVVFESESDALSPDDDDSALNIYRRDTVADVTILVSRGSDGSGIVADDDSEAPAISADGQRVAFVSQAALVPEDTNGQADVYVRDIAAGTTQLASRRSGAAGAPAAASSRQPELSADGSRVIFITEDALVDDDTNGFSDAYVRELDGARATTLVSRSSPGNAPVGDVRDAAIDGDGDRVAFVTIGAATAGDIDSTADAFARDLDVGTTVLVSRDADSASNGDVFEVSMDTTGRFVLFDTDSTDLLGDVDPLVDVFLHSLSDETTNVVALVDLPVGVPGCAVNDCRSPVISTVSDIEAAITLRVVPIDGSATSVVQRLLRAGTTEVVSRGDAAVVARNYGAGHSGRSVAFDTRDEAISAEDIDNFQDVFLRDPVAGTTEFVSRPTGTGPLVRGLAGTEEGEGNGRIISADGRYVAFVSEAPGLVPPDLLGSTRHQQVYRRDLRTGELLLVSRAGAAVNDGKLEGVAISADGGRVAFVAGSAALSSAVGAPVGIEETLEQVFVRDIAAGVTLVASRGDGPAGAPAGDGVQPAIAISGDGTVVAFTSGSPGLAPGQPSDGLSVLVRNLDAGSTVLASRYDGPAGAAIGGSASAPPALSADGTVVAFDSGDDGLDGDPGSPEASQVVVRDLVDGTTTVISRSAGGAFGNNVSSEADISADGRRVVFVSQADNLLPEDGDGGPSLLLADLQAGTLVAVGRAEGPAGAVDQNVRAGANISPDGGHVIWGSRSANTAGDTNGVRDGHVRDLATGATTRITPPGGGDGLDLSTGARCAVFDTRDGSFQAGGPTSRDFVLIGVRAVTAECPVPAPVVPGPGPVDPGPGPGPGPVVPGPGPVVPGPAPDTAAPALSATRLVPARFRVVGVRVPPGPRRPARAGTVLRLTLSEAATVRVQVQRRAAGKRVGARCLAPSRARRARANCIRFVPAGAVVFRNRPAGAQRIAITGRIGRRALAPGTYRLLLTAADAAGNRSAPRRFLVTIVRR